MKSILFIAFPGVLSLFGLSTLRVNKSATSYYYANKNLLASPTNEQVTLVGTTQPVASAHCFASTTIMCFVSSPDAPDVGATTLPTGAIVSALWFGLWH